MQTAAIQIDNVLWADRLTEFARAGKLKAGGWGDGYEVACFLSAAGPGIKSLEAMPCASVHMPRWMAGLTVTLFDGWRQPAAMAELAAPVMRKWHLLDDAAWNRVRVGYLIYCVESAKTAALKAQPDPKPAYWAWIADACDQVVGALRSGEGLEAAREAAAEAAVGGGL